MAFMSYDDLERLAQERESGRGDGGSELIATAEQKPLKTMAMEIGEDPAGSGQLCYLGERPVLFFDWKPCRGFFGTDRAITLSRLEVKTGRAKAGFSVGDQIILSEVPPSRCAVVTAHLKNGYKYEDGQPAKPEPMPEIARDYDALAKWLDDLQHDYWETDQHYLTAAVHSFDPPPVFVEDFRSVTNRGTAIGLCRDFEKVLATLRASPEWARMRDQALANKRRFWFANVHFVGLEDEVRTFVEDILELSVRQALAGPAYKVDDANQQKVADMIGQPVMQEAGRIFDLHLNRLNKRRARRNRPSRPNPEDRMDDLTPPEQADEGFSQDTAGRLSKEYEVDRNGALFLLEQIESLALYEQEDALQVRALDLLATAWGLPRPDRRRDLLLAYIEQKLAQTDFETALDEAEAFVCEAVSRF